MTASQHQPLGLLDYARNLKDPRERATVLQALEDAAEIPIDTDTLDDIEARFGDGAGVIDVFAYLKAEFYSPPARGEFNALMRAADQLRILIAFKKIDAPDGERFIRIDAIQ